METLGGGAGGGPPRLVLSLPMRDGNPSRTNHGPALNAVLSLPMRDGNPGPVSVAARSQYRFEPTYEGWKHALKAAIDAEKQSFEPTYEGWKQQLIV